MRRQPAVDLVFGPQAYHRLPEMIARAARGDRVLETAFEVERKFDELPEVARPRRARPPSSPSKRAATASAPFAWCPIRGVLNIRVPRPRSRPKRAASWKRAPPRSRFSDRTSTATTAGRPTGAGSWGLGRLIGASCRNRGASARLRYTTSHPCEMDAAADRGPWRDREADAVSASSRAIGLGPRARGDEPPPPRATITAASSQRLSGRGPTSHFPPTSSSAIRARARRISPPHSRSCARSASPRPIPSNTARAPARPQP